MYQVLPYSSILYCLESEGGGIKKYALTKTVLRLRMLYAITIRKGVCYNFSVKHSEICAFDMAFMSSLLEKDVEQSSCMAGALLSVLNRQ